MSTRWAAASVPGQHGRTVLVTGANSGIGFHQALELARRGAHVLLASRNADPARAARAAIMGKLPAASVELVCLDLADLDSVRCLADQLLDRAGELDLLINNARVMRVPHRQTTVQGFELQFGTNHLATSHHTPSPCLAPPPGQPRGDSQQPQPPDGLDQTG